MPYKVQLIYFRPTGKYLTSVETQVDHAAIEQIWEEIGEMRRLGRLPGLRAGAGRDLFVLVDVPEHPDRVPRLAMPPLVDEDDVTPTRGISTEPLVRITLAEIPRTTTRDVVRVDLDADPDAVTAITRPADEITPVDPPLTDEEEIA